nr:MAG TPA: hypothetical protein [Caudoviricetes sp.]
MWGLLLSSGIKPRETGSGDGVGSAPLVVRPLFPFGVSVILKI